MHFQHLSQLLAVSTAVLFGAVAATDYQTTSTSDVTTTMTTTIVATKTSTSVVVHTKTRETACPTAEAGVLNFDNLNTTGVSPMPLVYQDFNFDGSSGWQYFDHSSFAVNSSEYRSVSSKPNGLLSRSSGLVSFGSKDRGYSFDLTSLSFFGFVSNSTSSSGKLFIEFKLFGADNSTQTVSVEAVNGGEAPQTIDLKDLSGDFKNLVDVSIAAWQNYDNTTGLGSNPAAFVLDDIEYVQRTCPTDN